MIAVIAIIIATRVIIDIFEGNKHANTDTCNR